MARFACLVTLNEDGLTAEAKLKLTLFTVFGTESEFRAV